MALFTSETFCIILPSHTAWLSKTKDKHPDKPNTTKLNRTFQMPGCSIEMHTIQLTQFSWLLKKLQHYRSVILISKSILYEANKVSIDMSAPSQNTKHNLIYNKTFHRKMISCICDFQKSTISSSASSHSSEKYNLTVDSSEGLILILLCNFAQVKNVTHSLSYRPQTHTNRHIHMLTKMIFFVCVYSALCTLST